MALHRPLSTTAPVYTPEEQARALRALLGGRICGVWQLDGSGAYPGALSDFSDDDARAHYAGERTFAIAAVTDPEPRGRRRRAEQQVFPKTHLLGFDLDERFAQRLPLIARELQDRRLDDATIVTSGSDPGRGKVLVFFRRAYDARRVRNLGKKILDAARLDATWGIEVHPVEVYPLGGTGGLLRIGGRNRKAERHAFGCDVFFDLDGQPKSLVAVQPAQRLRFPVDPITIPVAPIGAWVSQALTYGLAYQLPPDFANAKRTERPMVGNTAAINRFMNRLAFEAIRFHCGQGAGYAHACNVYRGWLERITSASPGLQTPSIKNGDDRHPLDWDRRGASAWNAAVTVDRAARERAESAAVTLSSPGGAEPLDNVTPAQQALSPALILTVNERKVLPMLFDYARKKGITPDCFGISYREIAAFAGLSHAELARRAVRGLVRKGYVVIHDRGTQGKRGLPTILGLVSESPVRVSSAPAEHVPGVDDRRVLAQSTAALRCAAIAETRPNLRARRRRIEQFRTGAWKVEPQRDDRGAVETNVSDFGRKLAARRPNAPIFQQPLLPDEQREERVAAVASAPAPRKRGRADVAASKPPAIDPETAAPAPISTAPQVDTTSAPSPSPGSEATILVAISTRGASLSPPERDALLAQLPQTVFDELHADAERVVERTHSFLRALPAQFENFVRAKIVEIVATRRDARLQP